MRHTLIGLLFAALLFCVGCGGGSSPEDLAKEMSAAMKSGDSQKMANLQKQVEKFSPDEKQRYGTAMAKEMGFGDMMGGMMKMGEAMKNDLGKMAESMKEGMSKMADEMKNKMGNFIGGNK